MEWTDAGFGVGMTIVGGAISWVASWYYYFRSKPLQTSVEALLRAAEKAQGSHSSKTTQAPAQVALNIIRAFERHELCFPELAICARVYRIVGENLKDVLKAVDAAGVAAGPMLSQAWIAARDKTLKEGLAKAKEQLLLQIAQKENSLE